MLGVEFSPAVTAAENRVRSLLGIFHPMVESFRRNLGTVAIATLGGTAVGIGIVGVTGIVDIGSAFDKASQSLRTIIPSASETSADTPLYQLFKPFLFRK